MYADKIHVFVLLVRVLVHESDDLRPRRSMHGDSAPESAPLLLPYGKALVEIAIENQGVLGKEEPEKENDEGQEEGEQSCPSFQSGWTEESRSKLILPGMTPHDLLCTAAGPSSNQPTASASAELAEEQEEEEETEDDDFTIAWEILDLARILYQKRQSSGEDVGRELGECFGLLGDVSLENGKVSFLSFFDEFGDVSRLIRHDQHSLRMTRRKLPASRRRLQIRPGIVFHRPSLVIP